jgi:transmembrane sensor
MSERETAQAISDRAAEWVARIDREGGGAAARADLEAWLAGDERRRGAWFRAQAAWRMLDRASVLGAGQAPVQEAVSEALEDPGEVETDLLPADRGCALPRRRVLWGAGVAVAASLAAGLFLPGILQSPSQRIETALGEIRRVPLEDGSLAAVNTQTMLDVTLTPEVREIELARGEVWFQVAKDRARPFVVEAGEVRVKAVGTAFAVHRTDGGVDVQVTEGTVEVWREGEAGGLRRLSAGMRTFVGKTPGAPRVIAAGEEIDRSLSWRTGQLVFEGDTVAEAAAAFNRYNAVKLEITDPALGQEKMIGRFRTNEPDAFARAAAALLDARVETGAERIVLSRK